MVFISSICLRMENLEGKVILILYLRKEKLTKHKISNECKRRCPFFSIFGYFQLRSNSTYVSRVFQGSFKEVSRKFQGSFKEVLRKFQESFKRVSIKFQASFKQGSRMFLASFKNVSRVFQVRLMSVLMESEGSFKGVSRVFRKCQGGFESF